jgi:hypothetical protein
MMARETRMTYDLRDSDLSAVLAEGRLVAAETSRAFGHLSAEQINWKLSEAEWSIGQCFDHLIVANRPFFTIIEEVRQGRQQLPIIFLITSPLPTLV